MPCEVVDDVNLEQHSLKARLRGITPPRGPWGTHDPVRLSEVNNAIISLETVCLVVMDAPKQIYYYVYRYK